MLIIADSFPKLADRHGVVVVNLEAFAAVGPCSNLVVKGIIFLGHDTHLH